jgi:hypothetical protein
MSIAALQIILVRIANAINHAVLFIAGRKLIVRPIAVTYI